MYPKRQSLLPPRIPFASACPSFYECASPSVIGSKSLQKVEENSHLQRTSSESLAIEEQPSWLDDLLDEPDTPIRKGAHRRSSSDSFAYKNMMLSSSSWGDHDYDLSKDAQQIDAATAWDFSLNFPILPNGIPSSRESLLLQCSGTSSSLHEMDRAQSSPSEVQNLVESCSFDSKSYSERKDGSGIHSSLETDNKRTKQQFAQRSRVRKLQHIAELERNVQALQAEGSGYSAEIEFLNQQNLILSMENKALGHRLETLAQEQIIKYLEQDVLEREIGRLRAMYQLQQQQPQPSVHRRAPAMDLDSRFGNLSLKHTDPNPDLDHLNAPPHIR